MKSAILRIPPLGDTELTDEARDLLALPLDGMGAGAAQDFFRILLRHPGLYRRFAPFAGKLLAKGKLPARVRELAILRIAALCEAAFEWAQHVRIAREAGLTPDEIERVRRGSADGEWADDDALVLLAAEELHATARLSDAVWSRLAARFDVQQLIELPFLVGAYHMIAYVQNVLEIPAEPACRQDKAGSA